MGRIILVLIGLGFTGAFISEITKVLGDGMNIIGHIPSLLFFAGMAVASIAMAMKYRKV